MVLEKVKRRLGLSQEESINPLNDNIESDTPGNGEDVDTDTDINPNDIDALLEDLIDQSTDYVCLYLGISELNDFRLNSVVLNMTVDAYNKLGDEGKERSIYSDYRSDYATELIAPYISILEAVKRDSQNIIRFI